MAFIYLILFANKLMIMCCYLYGSSIKNVHSVSVDIAVCNKDLKFVCECFIENLTH